MKLLTQPFWWRKFLTSITLKMNVNIMETLGPTRIDGKRTNVSRLLKCAVSPKLVGLQPVDICTFGFPEELSGVQQSWNWVRYLCLAKTVVTPACSFVAYAEQLRDHPSPIACTQFPHLQWVLWWSKRAYRNENSLQKSSLGASFLCSLMVTTHESLNHSMSLDIWTSSSKTWSQEIKVGIYWIH